MLSCSGNESSGEVYESERKASNDRSVGCFESKSKFQRVIASRVISSHTIFQYLQFQGLSPSCRTGLKPCSICYRSTMESEFIKNRMLPFLRYFRDRLC